MFKRVFLIVLDSLGIGAFSEEDKGANTLKHVIGETYNLDVLEKLGLIRLIGKEEENTRGIYMRCIPANKMKDSLNGHYEMMGVICDKPYETYPNGFPLELISKIQKVSGRDVIGNIASDGVKIINELGQMQIKNGALIVYTSCDSVLQIAAHEDIITLEELYDICEKVRKIIDEDDYRIARVIARPFTGKDGSFVRTSKRRDFAVDPPNNCLTLLDKNGIDTICVGKIGDMFNNKSIKVNIKTKDNIDVMMKLTDFAKGDFNGLLFANLNDFDSDYGHRRDRDGYLKCLEEFNYYLPIFLKNLKKDDLVIITADHGCDPTYEGFDHTKEMVPILMYSRLFKKGKKIHHRTSLADISATILDNFKIGNTLEGKSIFDEFRKNN